MRRLNSTRALRRYMLPSGQRGATNTYGVITLRTYVSYFYVQNLFLIQSLLGGVTILRRTWDVWEEDLLIPPVNVGLSLMREVSYLR